MKSCLPLFSLFLTVSLLAAEIPPWLPPANGNIPRLETVSHPAIPDGPAATPGAFCIERSLNGIWKLSNLENSVSPFSDSPEEEQRFSAVDLDDSAWNRIPVPLNWYEKFPGKRVKGKPYVRGWYRTDFLLTEQEREGKRVVLKFDVAGYDAKVFLNGKYLGSHKGDFTPFELDATDAAKNGKKVTCLVELRARFDEENNIDWSKRLEEAGCRVIYGPPKFKVHCKLLLITYKDEGRIKKVAQIGTGNFNETTAKIYTDLAYFTANRKITEDVEQVFEALCEERFVESAQYLLVAPLCLKTGLLELIDEEIAKAGEHKPCGILLKMNSLTDKDLIDKLIEASRAGVKIKMLIRGICCLRPGIPGETENIDVTSIVGRFLEHSRIYVFGGGSAKKVYISSADFMTRNTEQRVEAAVPILQRDLKNRLVKQLRLQLSDTVKARTLTPSGKYVRRKPKNGQPPLDSQLALFREAYDRLALPVPEPKPPRKRKIKKQRGKDVPQ